MKRLKTILKFSIGLFLISCGNAQIEEQNSIKEKLKSEEEKPIRTKRVKVQYFYMDQNEIHGGNEYKEFVYDSTLDESTM